VHDSLHVHEFIGCIQVISGVVPNFDPRQIITPLVLVGLGLVVGEGLRLGAGLGLGNQVLTSRRGVIIWQGVEIRLNTGAPAYVLAQQTLLT